MAARCCGATRPPVRPRPAPPQPPGLRCSTRSSTRPKRTAPPTQAVRSNQPTRSGRIPLMPRLAPLDLNKLTPEQKKAADAIVAGPRGGLRGPFEPWLRRPELADRAQKLGEYCRFNNSLPKDLSELAICLVGRHFKAQYEFFAHAR